MSGPENTFIASVHKHLPPITELYRMKNHNQYNGGIADVWYSGGKDLWIEYKFVTEPKRPGTQIDIGLSPLQAEWLRGRYTEGRHVGVIVGCKAGGVWLHDFEWERPLTAAQFKSQVRTRPEIAQLILNATKEPV